MSEKQKSDCPGSYEVSGYTTDKGKKVDSYTRTCWKHGGGASGDSVQNTQESIDKTNEKLDEIHNKEEITDEDLDLSKGYLSATISKVCEDCENYLDENESKTETPTWESIEKAKDLKNTKNKILDNLEKSMSTVDKIEKIQKKKWDNINTTDMDYNNKLYEYAKSKETINNINKNLRYLHEAVSNSWGIAKNYINDLKNTIKQKFDNFITNHNNKNDLESGKSSTNLDNNNIYNYAKTNNFNPEKRENIKNFLKGKEGCRLEAYDDKLPNKKLQPNDSIKGTITIGYGTTGYINGEKIVPGMRISQETADKYLEQHIISNQKAVNKNVKVPLTQNQFDALTSFCYNVGPGNFESSTLLRLLNSGDYIGASNEFDKWVYSNGEKMDGLINRRAAEKELFLKDFNKK